MFVRKKNRCLEWTSVLFTPRLRMLDYPRFLALWLASRGNLGSRLGRDGAGIEIKRRRDSVLYVVDSIVTPWHEYVWRETDACNSLVLVPLVTYSRIYNRGTDDGVVGDPCVDCPPPPLRGHTHAPLPRYFQRAVARKRVAYNQRATILSKRFFRNG